MNDVSITVYVVCSGEPVFIKLKYALVITPGRYPRLPQDAILMISLLGIFLEAINNNMLKIAANEKNRFPGLMQIDSPRINPNSKLQMALLPFVRKVWFEYLIAISAAMNAINMLGARESLLFEKPCII